MALLGPNLDSVLNVKPVARPSRTEIFVIHAPAISKIPFLTMQSISKFYRFHFVCERA